MLKVKALTKEEKEQLMNWTMSEDQPLKQRAWVILLVEAGISVSKIAKGFCCSSRNLRKWVHRFNELGCQGLIKVFKGGRKAKITEEQKRQIVELSRKSPRSFGLNYGWWSLHRLTAEVKKQGIVSQISYESVRRILFEAGIPTLRGL